MARRRYVSTKISVDELVNKLACEQGDFAALLYTWSIPHCEDDATITGTADEILMQVVPGRRDKGPADVDAALKAMDALGLVVWDGARVWFPPEAFYRSQTYIREDRRRADQPKRAKSAQTRAKRRKTPQNAASFRPSPSVKPSVTPPPTPPSGGESEYPPKQDGGEDPPGFVEFWAVYPNQRERRKALRCFRRLIKQGVSAETLVTAARNYSAEVEQKGTEDRFVKRASTFLGPDSPWEDYVAGVPEEQRRRAGLTNGQRAALNVVQALEGGEDPDADASREGHRAAGGLLPPG